MSANSITLGAWLMIVGLVSSCGSGSDAPSLNTTPETVESDSISNDDATSSIEDTVVASDPVEIDVSTPQNDGEQLNTDSQQEPSNPDAADSDADQSVADTQRLNFGTASLLVDLVPNGDSYPAKFHRTSDKLYFWTVDTDPTFARCSSHWNNLTVDDKSIAFNLVAVQPETGVVAMNKQIMTLGDFAEYPNDACAGFNGSIMQVYEQNWLTQPSVGEQQFGVHFEHSGLGPDQVWMTDGSDMNTSQLESGLPFERSYFEDGKVFFVNEDGLWVSDSLSGDRRKLFESSGNSLAGNINHIVKSPMRKATFEIWVGWNRSQIWTYDLDTDEWEKTISLKPDENFYNHYQTLLVDGQKLLSLGYDPVESDTAIGLSSTYGDVRSFEIITNSAPTLLDTDTPGALNNSNNNGNDELFYTTTEFLVESRTTHLWSYQEERVEKIFSISEPDLRVSEVVAGHDGRIYVAGVKTIQQTPNFAESLELWSYNPQTEQLVELSDDDWYSVKHNFSSPDEGYVFRYLNTPDGLIFLNLKDDTGRELWFTDGTREGTRQLSDINPGSGNSDPQNFYYSGDAVYFSADDGIHGREPWVIRISR